MRPDATPAELTYHVPGVSCSHCESAITDEVNRLAGVTGVEVDLDRKKVSVRGDQLDDAAVREAITEAGYDVAA